MLRAQRTLISFAGVLACLDLSACGAPVTETTDQPPVSAERLPLGSSGPWELQEIIDPENGAEGDQFGYAAAMDGSHAVIGTDAERAVAYSRTGPAWSVTQTLTTTEGGASPGFGRAVAMNGDILVVGAPYDDTLGESSGAAHVFVRDGGNWSHDTTLTGEVGGTFGLAVAIDGTTIVVGAPVDAEVGPDAGAAYVFVRDDGGMEGWSLQDKLVSPSTNSDRARFGAAVSVSGDTVVIGAPLDWEAADYGGAAYFFARTGTTWGTPQRAPKTGVAYEFFGSAVAINGRVAVIGAPGGALFSPSGELTGVAYRFRFESDTWVPEPPFGASDESVGNLLGGAIALNSRFAVVAAIGEQSYSGAAYVYDLSTASQVEAQKVVSEEDALYEAYGNALALSGAGILVGAPQAADFIGRVYALGLTTTMACEGDADCASGSCVEGICCAQACGDPCLSCLAARKESGPDGACGPIRAGTDPKNDCDEQETSSCGTTGVCDGSGACSLHAIDVVCAPARCLEQSQQEAISFCDGAGTCVKAALEDCARGYLCIADACVTTCTDNDECAGGFDCIDGSCKVPRGEACAASTDCAAGSVCAGADGICSEQPTGPACETPPCDGESSCTCRVGPLCEGKAIAVDAEGARKDCFPYACRAGACLDECADSSECAPGVTCNPKSFDCEAVQALSQEASGCSVSGIGRSGPTNLSILLFLYLCQLSRARPRRSCAASPGRRHPASTRRLGLIDRRS